MLSQHIQKKRFSSNNSFASLQSLFSSQIIIEGPNLSLLPLNNTYFPELTKILNHENLWTFNPRFKCKSEPEVNTYLNHAMVQKQKEERYPFVILHRENQRLIGTTSFYNISTSNKTLSLGYTIIAPEYQRTGVNKESKRLMLDWCFKLKDFERLDFHVDQLNEKSVNSLKKFGAKQEGVLRSNVLVLGGSRRDTVVLSILRSEWNDRV